MKLRINQPQLAAELVSALNETDCFAAQTSGGHIDVYVPWVTDGDDARRAATELVFFVGAWAAGYPDCSVRLVD